MAVNFSTILNAVKPRDRTDQYVILAALHSLNAETNSVTVKQVSQVLKLHLGSKTPTNVSASLRKYSSYVEPVDPGPPLRWQLKPEGIAKLRTLSDLALTVIKSDSAFDTDIGIVCALEQPEFDAVREALGGAKAWKEIGDARYTHVYREAMHALQHAALVETAYGDNERAATFSKDANSVREALIRAVRSVHPGAKFALPTAQVEACAQFLDNFQSIFTTNYDLLLYWVILQRKEIHSDGFGRGVAIDGFRTFQTDAKCDTYYLHGALHLFLGKYRETKKRIVTDARIIDDIEQTIRTSGQLPLFVAEAQTFQKLTRINSVAYLRRGYQRLKEVSGNMFVFGHSVAANDGHIYGALFSSRIEQLFFCVHNANSLPEYQERLAPFSVRKPDLEIFYVDASSARVWG